jgi:hypothetical protein
MLPENIYHIDKTNIILSMLNLAKVLVSKDDTNAYRGVVVEIIKGTN